MKRKILILAGGWSREREVSLKSGRGVYENLPRERFDVDLYDPRENPLGLLERIMGVDLVINMLHGKKGEDGSMQGLLEIAGVRYLGSGVLGSALAMNKYMSKILFSQAGLKVPKGVLVESLGEIEKLKDLGLPLIVKPVDEGSSFGLRLCRGLKDLDHALKEGILGGYRMLVEEYIEGKELTCCVIGNRVLEALPIVEIVPLYSEVFDFSSKYEEGKTLEVCPARIDPKLAKKAQEIGIAAHRALGLRNFSRTDMILRGNEIFVLETNTLPGMTPTSLFPLAARAKGWSMSELLTRLVDLALEEA